MKNPRTPPKNRPSQHYLREPEVKTFLEHIQELRTRLFWIVIVFLGASAAAYPFFDKILTVLVRPLGNEQLYYLTPGGGLSFILKVCMFAGLVAAVPMMVYQLFRYIQPAMGLVRNTTIISYIAASIVLAASGVVLAYFISLPAALHFLTDFNLPQISAMLTADSYFSFVMTYLLAAAILFQLPLILLIINNVTPLTPSGLMKQQRYVIVAAFVAGAIISPTPDALNQALLAGPIIVMYQVGVVLVLLQNRLRAKNSSQQQSASPAAPLPLQKVAAKPVVAPVVKKSPKPVSPVYFSEVLTNRSQRPLPKLSRPVRPLTRPMARQAGKPPARSLDGFIIESSEA